MALIRPPLVLALYGTSLTQGRLNVAWPDYLLAALAAQPEAVGQIIFYNQGKGSQNSDWGLANAGLIADYRPTHILTEGFSINDAALTDGVNPEVTLPNHNANVTGMVAAWRAERADVDITIQTMSDVSAAGAPGRPHLADYYAADVALAAGLGLDLIDNYGGTAHVPGGWPKPGPNDLYQIDPGTGLPDGLHPVWAGPDGGVSTYALPNWIAWGRAKMAAWWPAD